LIDAEATARIGAIPHERTPSRVTQRNGYRDRVLTMTAGDVELRIPTLRAGSSFPSLLERRRRIDQALFAVVMEAYVHGVSTRKVDDLVAALGADTGISRERGLPSLRRPRCGGRRVPRPVTGRAGVSLPVRGRHRRQGPHRRGPPRPGQPGHRAGHRGGHRSQRRRAPAKCSASTSATAKAAPSGPNSFADQRPTAPLDSFSRRTSHRRTSRARRSAGSAFGKCVAMRMSSAGDLSRRRSQRRSASLGQCWPLSMAQSEGVDDRPFRVVDPDGRIPRKLERVPTSVEGIR
jgi:Transposase, Mutator family